MSDMLERAGRAVAQTQIPAYADDKIWAEDLPMWRRRLARSDVGGIDNPFATARAALLAALDPEDEELWDEIGCEIGGGSGDEEQAVEAAFYVRLVIREIRKRIAQGEQQP